MSYIINDNGVERPATPEETAVLDSDKLRAEQLRQQNGYKISRAAEYPAIGDQLDALFHAGVFPADMAATIQAIKNKYPKPE
jgi:hypothetical protein